VLKEPMPKYQPKAIRDSNSDFRINSDVRHRLIPKCSEFILLSASVISPSVVKISWWLYEKC